MRKYVFLLAARSSILSMLIVTSAIAQVNLQIYSDSLANGFQDWGWAPRSYTNTSPVHSGITSVSVTISDSSWQGLQIVHGAFDSTPYESVTFWINGGTSGGQRLQIYGLAQVGSTQNVWQISQSLGTLQTNTWQQFTIPLSALGLADKNNATGIVFQDRIGAPQPTFFLDDIEFNAKSSPPPPPVPPLVHVSINTTQVVRTVDARHFGVNLAIWDGNYEPGNYATTASLLTEMGCLTVRLPGGSLSDEYHFSSNTSWTNTWQWQTSFPEFMRVATNINAQLFVTVNYGSGSPQEAAAWVAYANGDAAIYGTPGDITIGVDASGRDWRTAGYWARLRTLTAAGNADKQYDFLAIDRSAPFGIRNWEIGNECYGTWERDTNNLPNHAYTYAVRAANYLSLMKLIDPSIKVGVVSAPGESAYANGYNDHPAWNPRTSKNNYGWTPVLLTTLKNLGATPDFLVHHHYPEWTDPKHVPASPDNDASLLQSTGNWTVDAATIRQHISDYFGPEGTNLELVVTENNSDAGQQGRQSTSLVNGLYYADSLGQLLQTEFNGFVWWDLRNSTDSDGFFGGTLYGWRSYGDLGMINGASTRHPTFYAAKLMQWFARPGDKILSATTDYDSLSIFAARRANGSVTLLALNKSLVTNLNAQFSLNGFAPATDAIVRSYGIPNDEAARTNASATARDLTTNSIANAGSIFAYNTPRLSMTLFTLTPEPPTLAVVAPATPVQFVFQLQGQMEVRYVVQSSTNLVNWSIQSTNTLVGNSLNFTNLISADTPQEYWRAVWQP